MIEVGEYVRTDNGIIGRYVKFKGSQDSIETNNKWIGFDIEKDITKHSKNIIDLIEVGDYVNGEKVFSIEKDAFIKGQIDIFFNRDEVNYWGDRSLSQITDKDIKSIVTKEQFANIEYRLEENK